MDRLGQLRDAGVSIWLDTLSRDLLESGDFAVSWPIVMSPAPRRNPTIFAKAIRGSDRYERPVASEHTWASARLVSSRDDACALGDAV
jgi:transaldolase